MPRTSNLGDLQGSSLPARMATPSGTVNIAIDTSETRTGATRTRYEQVLSIAACVSLIACGVGVGIWASV